MQETLNNVFIAGQLVKVDLEPKKVNVKDEKGNIVGQDDALSGSLILRTTDGSEHEVSYYSRKTKKDGTANKNYSALETVKREYKSLEHFPNEADVVRIGSGQFSVNDYKSQRDGEVKTYIGTKANFVNRLSDKDLETTPLEGKFEIEGVVESIKEESYRNEATGNYRIVVNVLGYNGTIIPVTVTVVKEMAEAFMGAGFFEGGYAKFTGKLVNTKETQEVREEMAFGEANVKVVTKTVSRFEVTGGSPMGMPADNKIEDAAYEQAKSKRKLKLKEIKEKENNSSQSSNTGNNPFGGGQSQPTQPSGNPFANPFAK